MYSKAAALCARCVRCASCASGLSKEHYFLGGRLAALLFLFSFATSYIHSYLLSEQPLILSLSQTLGLMLVVRYSLE